VRGAPAVFFADFREPLDGVNTLLSGRLELLVDGIC